MIITKCYVGSCDSQSLRRLSLGIIGISLTGNFPENVIVMPLSKKHKNRHIVRSNKGSLLEPNERVNVNDTRAGLSVVGFFSFNRLDYVCWTSARGNKLTASKNGDDLFIIKVCEETDDCCFYRELIERQGIELVLQG